METQGVRGRSGETIRADRSLFGLAMAVHASCFVDGEPMVGRYAIAASIVLGMTSIQGDGGPPLTQAWLLVDGTHWQIDGGPGEPPDVTDAREGTRGDCPPGMVDVRGSMRVARDRSVEELQNDVCTDWIARSFPQRCARFDSERWLEIVQKLDVRPMQVCIDRFEYPNRRGAYPIIVVTWNEASAACGAQGKRLCTEDEWTFACEGESALPYPYGYVRDSDACVIDRPWREVDEEALRFRDSAAAIREIDRLWQGKASGESTACRSPFGVYDMTGNVDEWTRSARAEGFRSILKGGYWGPVRTRCRPSTRAHGEGFAFYQQGFRCCADGSP